jgi:uncharacterized membrane protein
MIKNRSEKSPQKLSSYLRTKEAYWYWITLILSALTLIFTFTIPEDAYPLVYIRYILGGIFVLWLPGYALIRALFPKTKQNDQPTKSLGPIELITLSLGISLAIIPLVGLLLNYSPWGITLPSITLSLLLLTIIFATTAIIREHRKKLEN